MLEEVGKHIRHLYLSDFNEKTSKMTLKSSERFYNNYILGLRPELKCLTINNSASVVKCNPTKKHIKYTSLETLEIISSNLDQATLSDLSFILPNLKYLSFSDCNFNNNQREQSEKYTIKLDLSNCKNLEALCFNTGSISNTNSSETINNFYARITATSPKKFYYFAGNGYSIRSSSLLEYINETNANANTLYLDIICQKLKSFWIKLDEGYAKECFQSL